MKPLRMWAAVIPVIMEKLRRGDYLPQDLGQGPGNLLVDSSVDCDSVALLQKFALDSTSCLAPGAKSRAQIRDDCRSANLNRCCNCHKNPSCNRWDCSGEEKAPCAPRPLQRRYEGVPLGSAVLSLDAGPVSRGKSATSVVQAPTRIIDASQSSWHDPEARVPSVPAYFVASATGKTARIPDYGKTEYACNNTQESQNGQFQP
ncbi:hypothetical protein JEQ12_008218 [Ovis aries]|uniref:Uncharacterized protein n=1 Tax=Ovis aries TaxID=9940 RepID=A0A835ZQU8_SHEEP|nr:hypothetical protein JEQ12_008218 [Ovis aries]